MIRVTTVWATALLIAAGTAKADYSVYDLQSNNDEIKDYFEFEETKIPATPNHFSTPDQFLNIELQNARIAVTEKAFNLLSWKYIPSEFTKPSEHYNRLKHFGGWASEPNDHSCFNTRAKVLERDSLTPVQTSPNNHCVVVSGTWKDPYTGTTLTTARDVQIDHVVPLKQAYLSGAFSWNKQKRCLYGNFMKSAYHLLSVKGFENMRKGDKTPAQYLPPNRAFVCDYIRNWLKIKLAWKLVLSSEEGYAINQILKNHSCNTQSLQISEEELTSIREQEDSAILCGNDD
jgi:hypothetical protein